MDLMVGNTPMIKIKYSYNGHERYIYAKLESYNITGSIKDRIVYYIIKKAYSEGKLKKGMEIVEATSGNTGISISAIGKYFGNSVHIFMPNWVSRERVELMKAYGAKLVLVSKEEGGFKTAVKMAVEYAKKNKAFCLNQFSNNDNVFAHYETTGVEIVNTLGNTIGGFVSGIGTGGTLIGTGKRLKKFDKNIKLYSLEPDKMPLLSQGKVHGNHKIEGIGDDFIPDLVDRSLIDKIIVVNDDDSVNMARKLALNLGLGVGISSGANMIASVIANETNSKAIVTVFPDDNKKYLSTDLSKSIDENPKFISNKVRLLDYQFVEK